MPVPSSAPVPMLVPPSKKVTVPVGTALPAEAATVAVNVMLVPLTALVADEASVVVVAVAFTLIETADDTLVLKLESPA